MTRDGPKLRNTTSCQTNRGEYDYPERDEWDRAGSLARYRRIRLEATAGRPALGRGTPHALLGDMALFSIIGSTVLRYWFGTRSPHGCARSMLEVVSGPESKKSKKAVAMVVVRDSKV